MNLKGDFGITQKPTEQRFYTTEEIAKLLKCSTAVIRNITSYYHIDCDKKVRDKSARRSLYSYEAFKRIKEHREARLSKKKQIFVNERTPEEIAALEDHSLVTDKRCLDLNYWPDIIPDCFKECEQ